MLQDWSEAAKEEKGDETSTKKSLRRRAMLSSRRNLAPMRSIRRGSLDWQALIRPFVSDLAFRCLVRRRSESDISFRPWSSYAAVLFVDLSSYSSITSAIAHKGAYVLSNIVNAYLDRLLKIAKAYGGDVVKFAGDAVLIVWEASEEDLQLSVLCAAQCVLMMQDKAGEHPVEGTDLKFRIHCGLCCGELDTEIFVAPSQVNMQRLYHAVGGEPLQEIGDLVDMAKAGEVCISKDCANYLESYGKYRKVGPNTDAHILVSLENNDDLDEMVEKHIDKLVEDREAARIEAVEEDFIHPGVLKLLTHSGQAPTQLAQMRNLCVLFIGMTSSGNPVNWLMEIQGVLDAHRCPIIQIIDDDKGVHVVAAINLYESVPEATLLALEICHELVSRQVGCAVGVAQGSSFCGVTGSATVACRWDITGPAAVRASRLMQYALQNDLEVAIDESIYTNSSVAFRMKEARTEVQLKGSSTPCSIFTLSESRKSTSSMILETLALAPVHQDTVAEIVQILKGPSHRGVVVVTGPPFAGKKAVCQLASGLANLVPVLHVCDEAAGHLQLARTIATWFSHYKDENVREAAKVVIEHLNHNRWSRAHDECVQLVNKAILSGYGGCFVVDRCQFLDDFSISLIRECLDGRIRSYSKHGSFHSSLSSVSESSDSGRSFFLCTHVPLYHFRSAKCFVSDLQRTRRIKAPIFEVKEVTRDELKEVVTSFMDLDAEGDFLDLYSEMTGSIVGYFLHRVRATRLITSTLLGQGRIGVSALSENLSLFVPPKMARVNKRLNVISVNAELAMRFTQVFDELPPRFQIFMKVVTIVNRRCNFKCPLDLLKEVLYDIIVDDEEALCCMDEMTAELEELYLIKLEPGNGCGQCGQLISVQCPALSDVVFDVCTPAQVQFISRALIDRLESYMEAHFTVPLVIAALYGNLGDQKHQKEFWVSSYEQILSGKYGCPKTGTCRLKELIEEEIEAAGYTSQEILGKDFGFSTVGTRSLSHSVIMLKSYCAPISLGPLGHSLTVITRVASREVTFRGAPCEAVESVRKDGASAFKRYKEEVQLLEDFMESEGFGVDRETRDAELSLLEKISTFCDNKEEQVFGKPEKFLDEFVPRYVEPRLQRLYMMVEKLRMGEMPSVMLTAPEPIRGAYRTLASQSDRNDAVQDTLVTLASLNWTPKQLPEYLPIVFYQTTARIRDEVLRRLNDEEIKLLKHQHSVDDLEAFLITTALLNDSCVDCRRLSVESLDRSGRESLLSSDERLGSMERSTVDVEVEN